MQTANRLSHLREAVDELRAKGPVALVPTMGALHDGHMALVREARRKAASVIVSIFVNPTQFGPNEDLDAYPRQMEEDARLLEAEKVDLLWAPTVEEMYPAGFATSIHVAGLSDVLCGASRPGHFDGVATVVAKLFNQVRPDMAFFGEKDWQQLAIIRRMAADLDLTHPAASQIIGVPTVREPDGLAMSSRNRYLSPEDRQKATALPREMRKAVEALADGGEAWLVLAELRASLLAHGFETIDYIDLLDTVTLASADHAGPHTARLFTAVRIAGTRLIDNVAVDLRG